LLQIRKWVTIDAIVDCKAPPSMSGAHAGYAEGSAIERGFTVDNSGKQRKNSEPFAVFSPARSSKIEDFCN
jgi:hypothetical protein